MLICTSGTAAANYFPAVVEASRENIPMIVISADRPPELRDSGANQTIQQVGLFGEYTRWQIDLPCPTVNISPAMVLSSASQAYGRATALPGGPVHINCMFREPLAPLTDNLPPNYLKPIQAWLQGNTPYTEQHIGARQPGQNTLMEISEVMAAGERGIVVLGGLKKPDAEAAVALAAHLKWPVFADLTSQTRLTARQAKNSQVIIDHYDAILDCAEWCRQRQPAIVLHIGGRFISKRLQQFLQSCKDLTHIHVSDDPRRLDPGHQVSHKIVADAGNFSRELKALCSKSKSTKWLRGWQQANAPVAQKISELTGKDKSLNELSLPVLVTEGISHDSGVFLAASMPVRDMDMLGISNERIMAVAANRGASGIDGTIASAAGFAAGLELPVVLIVGDLAFIHDVNSLALLKDNPVPLYIILVNNRGGGIFSFLPVKSASPHFEKYFGTPHNIQLKYAAKLFDLPWYQPESITAFRKDFKGVQRRQKSCIIEINSDREKNYAAHQTFLTEIGGLLIDEMKNGN